MKGPRSKHQEPKKIQIPKIKHRRWIFGEGEPEACLSGDWSLDLGASL